MAEGMTYDEIVRASVALGVPRGLAERAAADDIAKRAAISEIRVPRELPSPASGTIPPGSIVAYHLKRFSPRAERATAEREALQCATEGKVLVHVGADRFAICKATMARDFDTFTATFELPPRTKKNSTRWFGVQSAAYARYRNAIVDAVGESRVELGLPLPNQPYNLAATFYVDAPGARADMFGLLQGLADALQDASVVTDDFHFRTTDGCRIISGDDRPRVELTITPIEDPVA